MYTLLAKCCRWMVHKYLIQGVNRFMCLFPCHLSSFFKILKVLSHWRFLHHQPWSHILSVCFIFERDHQVQRIHHFMAIYPKIRVLDFWGSYFGVCRKFMDDFKVIWSSRGLLIWIWLDPRSLIDEKIVLGVYDCPLSRLMLLSSCITSKDNNLVILCLLELIFLSQWT